MSARMRRLLLLVEACQKAGHTANASRLRNMAAMSEVTILEDLQVMKSLGMVDLQRGSRRTVTGGCFETVAVLTPKGEQVVPRVRELV